MKLLLTCGICLLLLISGCAKRVSVKPPTTASDAWHGPTLSNDGTYVFWTNDHGEYFFVSKQGPTNAQKQLCPKGAVCSTENVGQMYHMSRTGNQ